MKIDTRVSRKFTCKVLDMVDQGILDKDSLIEDLLNFMSESDVKQFCEMYLGLDEDEEDGE